MLATAILDRLLHHSTILNIKRQMIVLGNTASPGTIPKRLERLRDALEVVFRTKRLRPQGRGRLRYQKPVIL